MKKGIRGASRVAHSTTPGIRVLEATSASLQGKEATVCLLTTQKKRYVTALIEAAAQVHGSARIWGTRCQKKMETSLRWAGVSSLEVHSWRLPTTEDELLPKKRTKK